MKTLLSLLMVLLLGVVSAQAQGQRAPKKLYVSGHYGSLAGFGLGLSFVVNPTVSVDVAVGIPTFLDIVVGQPFAGNVANSTLAIHFKHPSGVYLAPGLHAGYYRMKANDKYNLRFVEETETVLLVQPQAAVGLEWASRTQTRRFSIEVGVAVLIPERITRELQIGTRTWVFEAERSLKGPFFPFYTFRMKI